MTHSCVEMSRWAPLTLSLSLLFSLFEWHFVRRSPGRARTCDGSRAAGVRVPGRQATAGRADPHFRRGVQDPSGDAIWRWGASGDHDLCRRRRQSKTQRHTSFLSPPLLSSRSSLRFFFLIYMRVYDFLLFVFVCAYLYVHVWFCIVVCLPYRCVIASFWVTFLFYHYYSCGWTPNVRNGQYLLMSSHVKRFGQDVICRIPIFP